MRAIDLFAGWGGFTTAAISVGVDVVYAANHWPLAVEAHRMNYPLVEHVCQDLRQADYTRFPRYELLLASPACQGHSSASRPNRRVYHDAMRATAWAVIDCADVTSPRAIIVENVLDFRRWRLYPEWCAALAKLGYFVTAHVVRASRLGVPQRRTRLLITATRRPIPLAFDEDTRERAFGPEIDWGAPGWKAVRSASLNVQARIAKGRERCGRRFLSQHVTNHPGVPLDEPIRTITSKDQWLLVDGDAYRSLTLRELARGMDLPERYRWPADATRKDVIKGLGNAVPPRMVAGTIRRVAEMA